MAKLKNIIVINVVIIIFFYLNYLYFFINDFKSFTVLGSLYLVILLLLSINIVGNP